MKRIADAVRVAGVVAALALVTAVLFPFQWVALKRGRGAGLAPYLWHRAARVILGLKVRQHGRPSESRPLLIAANHVSWLDIVVLGSTMPLSFIAKSEVGGWPVVRFLARMQRTVYVDRSRRTRTAATGAEIADRLAAGDPVVLFAEGTSSNGNEVLPFRSALIGAARQALGTEAEIAVQPLSIAYSRLGGLPLGRIERHHVAWYGDMDLAPHLLRVLSGPPLDAEVTWGAAIPLASDGDRKVVTAAAEAAVRRLTAAALAGRAATAGEAPAPATR